MFQIQAPILIVPTADAKLAVGIHLHAAGLAAYRARNFDDAANLFTQVLDARAADQPGRMMLERCRRFSASPPGDDWDATNAMQTK